MEPPFHVFLSHNSQDKPIVREIRRFLLERELRSWIDEEELTPGKSWQEEIERVLTSVPVVAVLVGQDGLGPWERPEMRVALSQHVKRRMPVIPVLLPGAPRKPEIPPLLGELTWVDLRSGLDSRGIDRLVHGITGKKPVVATEKQALADALEEAHLRKEELTMAGLDTQAVVQEILELHRKIREGGRLKTGDILAGRFRLSEPLGRGGFATVWKAYDRKDQSLVAVKVLHGQFGEDRTRLERFFRGARKMAELQHEGIVRVLERRLDDGGFHFFVMEYVSGGDLRQAVLEKRLAPERVVPIVCEVAAALGFAHRKDVVHRDVKPANILLDADGRPKLTDFDLVRAFDTTGGTMGDGMLGTFLYTAPEAMSNPQEAGVTTDVYSLAMTAAFCLFGAELPVEVLRDAERFLRRLTCSPGVRVALQKAAAWEPEERFGSVDDLARALETGREAPKEALLAAKAEVAAEKATRKSKQRESSGTTLVKRIKEEIPKLQYFRFQLLISGDPAGGYAVHALTPRGEGRGHFSLPFPIGEACQAFRRNARAGRHLSLSQAAPTPSQGYLGEGLFRALFEGEILRLYERSLDLLAADPESGLRLELILDPLDADLAALQALPWELLRQPDTPEFLSLNRRRPIVRYFMVARPVYAAAQPRTLRILAVAANPRQLPALDLAREFANLRQAVSSAAGMEVVWPAAPTLAALRQALRDRECHVLHFMGHGGSAATPAQKVLFFETEDGDSAPVRGTDLMNKLADFPTLRLVVLNACESAAVPGEIAEETEPDVFSAVASSLVLGGMPAVVAMQLPISDPAAIAFSRVFYQRLAAGDPVDAAVAEGRQEVHSLDPSGTEWATPVLFLRTRTGELYPGKAVWDPAVGKKRARRLAVALLALLLVGGAGLAARDWRVERLVAEGAALFQQRRWSAARERFQAALKLASGSSEVLSDLAGAEEKLGYVQAAWEHYREAVLLRPDSAEHLYNLGHFLVGRKSYDEAYRVLSQAVARDPQRADAYGDLAQAAAGLKMVERARAFLGVALRLDPERPAFHLRLGELELAAGNPRCALDPLDEARRGYPQGDLGRVETTWLRAEAYDRLGDVVSTCREIRELRRLDPPGMTSWAEQAERVASRRGCQAEP